jgi:hypothetical protein
MLIETTQKDCLYLVVDEEAEGHNNLMAQEKPLSKNERTQRAPCKYEHMMNQVSFLSQTFTRLEKAQNFVRRALLMGQRFPSPVCE